MNCERDSHVILDACQNIGWFIKLHATLGAHNLRKNKVAVALVHNAGKLVIIFYNFAPR